jgi:hypothetical protein
VLDWINTKITDESKLYGSATNIAELSIKLNSYKVVAQKIFRKLFYEMPDDVQINVMKFAERKVFPETYQDGGGEASKKSLQELQLENLEKVKGFMSILEQEYYINFDKITSIYEPTFSERAKNSFNYDFMSFVFNYVVDNVKDYYSELIKTIKSLYKDAGKAFNSTVQGRCITLYGFFSVNTFYSFHQEFVRKVSKANWKPVKSGTAQVNVDAVDNFKTDSFGNVDEGFFQAASTERSINVNRTETTVTSGPANVEGIRTSFGGKKF